MDTNIKVATPKKVSPEKQKAHMKQKKVAIVKESPTVVNTMTKVTQDLADGSNKCVITTSSRPYMAPKKDCPFATSTDKKVATHIIWSAMSTSVTSMVTS